MPKDKRCNHTGEEPEVTLGFRCKVKVSELLDGVAKERGRSKSYVIRDAVIEMLISRGYDLKRQAKD